MRIAFHAPLKPPDSPVPSGDRRMARLLIELLGEAGHEVELATRLRSLDKTGDPGRQMRLRDLGASLADRFLRGVRDGRAPRPDLWFTYHLYYKAPDWIGPVVADALSIPYVVAEASHAPKRAGGPWDVGHRAVEAALGRADLVIGLNPVDAGCVAPLLRPGAVLETMRPFLDTAPYKAVAIKRPERDPVRLLAVGMMRYGAKRKSYEVLASALERLADRRDWCLEIIGDGPARVEVEAAMAVLGDRVRFVGAVGQDILIRHYAAADLLVWPAIDEAYGMALLEAQATGLPVVAGGAGGVPAIVRDGETGRLVPVGDADAFAAAVASLLDDPGERRRLGDTAARLAVREHDVTVAHAHIQALLTEVTARCR